MLQCASYTLHWDALRCSPAPGHHSHKPALLPTQAGDALAQSPLVGPELTAEALLASLNKCYARVLPNREPLELLMVPEADVVAAAAVAAAEPPATAQSTAQAQSAAAASSTGSASTSGRTAASAGKQRGGDDAASTAAMSIPGNVASASTSGRSSTASVAAPTTYQASPWQQFKESYWTPGKMTFWGFVVLFRCGA